jgi:hypothetical protein
VVLRFKTKLKEKRVVAKKLFDEIIIKKKLGKERFNEGFGIL